MKLSKRCCWCKWKVSNKKRTLTWLLKFNGFIRYFCRRIHIHPSWIYADYHGLQHTANTTAIFIQATNRLISRCNNPKCTTPHRSQVALYKYKLIKLWNPKLLERMLNFKTQGPHLVSIDIGYLLQAALPCFDLEKRGLQYWVSKFETNARYLIIHDARWGFGVWNLDPSFMS